MLQLSKLRADAQNDPAAWQERKSQGNRTYWWNEARSKLGKSGRLVVREVAFCGAAMPHCRVAKHPGPTCAVAFPGAAAGLHPAPPAEPLVVCVPRCTVWRCTAAWELPDAEPTLDPYNNSLVMPLHEWIEHPLAQELIHNGATLQVTCLIAAHEVAPCSMS